MTLRHRIAPVAKHCSFTRTCAEASDEQLAHEREFDRWREQFDWEYERERELEGSLERDDEELGKLSS